MNDSGKFRMDYVNAYEVWGISYFTLFCSIWDSQTELRWIEFSCQRNWLLWSETNFSSSTKCVLIFSSNSLVQGYVFFSNLCIFFGRVWNFPFANLFCMGCMRTQPTDILFEKLNLDLSLTARNRLWGQLFTPPPSLQERFCWGGAIQDLIYCLQQQLVFLSNFVLCTV